MRGRDSFILDLVSLCVSSFALGIVLAPTLGGGLEWTTEHTLAAVLFLAVNAFAGRHAYVSWRERPGERLA